MSTAYFNTDGERKLGIVYCWNRPSAIVHLTLPDNPIPDSEDDQSLKEKKIDEKEVSCTIIYNSRPCRSPRVHFSEGGPVVIFLSSDLGPHGSCSRLHSVTLLPTGQIKDDCVTDTVVDAVWEPAKHVDKGGFPGLYISHLPLSPFIYFNGTLYALAVSNWGCHQVLLAIAINGNKKVRTPHRAYISDSNAMQRVMFLGYLDQMDETLLASFLHWVVSWWQLLAL